MKLTPQEKRIVELDAIDTFAEGVAVKRPGELPMAIVNRLADDVILVEEDEIREGMRVLFRDAKQVADPAGAVTIAACIAGAASLSGKDVACCIVSGGNVNPDLFAKVITGK